MNINLNHIPNGISGPWEVSEFDVSKANADWNNLLAAYGKGARMIKPGRYKRLSRNGKVIMSNTPAEIRDHSWFIRTAQGSVLINGLGLGMCASGILGLGKCSDITIVEQSVDVINLVAPYIRDKRVSIVNDDAFTFKPPKGHRYNAVWHDIWDDLNTDNLSQMATLHRRYGSRCDWQGSWGKEILIDVRNSEKRESSRWAWS